MKYFLPGKKPVEFPLARSSEENLKLQFIEVASGKIWIFTLSGILEWTESSSRVHAVPFRELSVCQSSAAIWLSKNNIVMAATRNQILKVDPESGKKEVICAIPERIIGFVRLPGRDLTLYSRNNVYALKDGSLSVVYAAQKSQISHDHADPRADLLWISTNKGLVRLVPVDAVSNYKIPSVSVGNRVVVSLAHDRRKTIWLVDR